LEKHGDGAALDQRPRDHAITPMMEMKAEHESSSAEPILRVGLRPWSQYLVWTRILA
jgi:hypothetical protein